MSVQVMITAVPTGEFGFTCYGDDNGPVVYDGYRSYEAVSEAMAEHKAVCATCEGYGCYSRPTVDIDRAVSWSNQNAAAVFSHIGVAISDEDSGYCGTISAADLLAACQIALATGAAVVHARPATDTQGQFGPRMVDYGLDEAELVERTRMLADLATEALHLGRDLVWS